MVYVPVEDTGHHTDVAPFRHAQVATYVHEVLLLFVMREWMTRFSLEAVAKERRICVQTMVPGNHGKLEEKKGRF